MLTKKQPEDATNNHNRWEIIIQEQSQQFNILHSVVASGAKTNETQHDRPLYKSYLIV